MTTLIDCLSLDRLHALLARVPNLRIGVIGDICLDAYWTVDMTRARLSRETPHFARPVVAEVYGPGAGANVAQNLAAAGVDRVAVFSVTGADLWGERLHSELSGHGKGSLLAGIDTAGICAVSGRRTNAYIKPLLTGYHSQQEDSRLDFENTAPLDPAVEADLLARLETALPGLDALIIADQLEQYGVVTPRIRARLNQLAEQLPEKIFLADSRMRIREYSHMIIKPNELEATAAVAEASLSDAGKTLSRASGRPVWLTLGENGVLVCTPIDAVQIPAAPVRPPLDIVGAGDAFLAWLAAGLAAGAAPAEAGALANLAAAVTVEKLNQTGTATPEEILERYRLCEQS
ncbi:MAG: PfkB family carbohydrate kinase [Desulfobacterales bacterium]|nr:PfkB family carbohydrate kinase [Desulfobacterales bacterium]